MQKSKKSIRSKELMSAAVYTLSTIFSKGLAIITVPIFTRIMTTADIGVVNIFNSWFALLGAIATLSLTSGGYSVGLKDYEEKRDEYVSSILSLTSIVALAMGVIYLLMPHFWEKLIGLPRGLIILMLIGFFVSPATDFWLARQRYEYNYIIPGLLISGSATVASLLSVLTVISLGNSGSTRIAEGRLYANYIVVFGIAAILWVYQIYKGKTFYNREYWTVSLSLSIPLVGYSLAAQILSVSDRMMIDYFVNKSAVGIYSTLYTVSSISLLVWNALNTSFVPYLFQNIEKKESKIKSTSFYMILLYSLIAIALTFFAPEIVKILATEEYYEAIFIMPPIAAGVFLTSVSHTYSNILVYYKKTKYVMLAASYAALSNILLNFYFIPKYGYMAAAYTTLFSYVILAGLQMYWGNKVSKENNTYPVYYDRKIIILSVMTIVVNLCSLYIYNIRTVRYLCIFVFFVLVILLAKKVLFKKDGNAL